MPKNLDRFRGVSGKRQVLVVDDELINRELLRLMLENDFEVIFASNGVEAMEQIKTHIETLSLVLLDLLMPRMSGQEVLRALREDTEAQRLPVIVLTSDQEAEIECLALGAIDFISKPYPKPGVVLARVIRTIELFEDRDIIRSTERDPLTGLYNREFFYHFAEQFDQRHWGMDMDAIVVDVNHFHMINERHGKSYADGVLRRIGESLREMVRDSGGIVCRWEADTFMVYCPHRADCRDILEYASSSLSDDSASSRVRLRMGVYSKADKSIDIARRFDRAKLAADTVRNNYAQSIGLYDQKLHEYELYAEQLVEDFPEALEKKQFLVYYQPKFDVRPDQPLLTSAEALVRWKHPTLGMISPGTFIPLFEENGMIQQLDHYVWEEAAAQIHQWKERFGVSIPVSVNVSRVDMFDSELTNHFLTLLKKHHLSPDEFLLEITESAYTNDADFIVERVKDLRRHGFQIEMDDFGTGYSSLGMISHLPIDALKLDMMFVRNAFSEHQDIRMLELILDIAKYLGVPTIAEGVETEEQMIALKTMGCDIVQGYFFSRPLPPAQFERFIEARMVQMAEATGMPAAAAAKIRLDAAQEGLQSITTAMNSNFDSLYYIDTDNGNYLEFGTKDWHEDLKLQRGGADFFSDAKRDILLVIYPDDQERLAEALSRDFILEQLRLRDVFSITCRLVINGEPRYYSMKATRTKGDGHHIMIGVQSMDERVTQEITEEQTRMETAAYRHIAEALADGYEYVYYVDIQTDAYATLNAKEGEGAAVETRAFNFFEDCQRDLVRSIYLSDRVKVSAALGKRAVLRALERDGGFELDYRMVFDGEPLYYRMKAYYPDASDPRHFMLAVRNVDSEISLRQKFEDAQESSVTFARISQALSQDYFTVYYVNVENNKYMEFRMVEPDHQLMLVEKGDQFFDDCRARIPERVLPADRERVLAAFSKNALLGAVADGSAFSITYEVMVDGKPTHVNVKAIRLSDLPSHIVVGMSDIESQVQWEKEFEAAQQRSLTHSRIAQALAADYFSIYYVNVTNDRFLEFSSQGNYEELGIEKEGEDFFNLSRKNVLRVMYPEDTRLFLEAFTKENMLRELDQNGSFILTYRLMLGGVPTYVSMKAMRMEDGDREHIVIGVNNIHSEMQRRKDTVTYASIAEALAADYFSIYYVDTDTDQFVEYSSQAGYEVLGIEKHGEDFFNLSRQNVLRVMHPDDLPRFLSAFTKENLLRELSEKGTFTITYRLMFNGVPTYANMKATRMANKDDPHIVIGVNNVDAQMKRQEAYNKAQSERVTFARIAMALSKDYFSIYLVNTQTDEFVEYSSTDKFKELRVEQSGSDFFEDCRRNVMRLVYPEDLNKALSVWDKEWLLGGLSNGSSFSATYRLMIDGEPRYINAKVIRMEESDNQIIIGISDVDSQIRREQAFEHQLHAAQTVASQDALTGVKNKYAFTEAENQINQEISEGACRPFAVVVCDVNGLKRVNDTMGHKAGDLFIRDACSVICDNFKHSPVYRIGGDEFVVILKGQDYDNRGKLMDALTGLVRKHRREGGVVIASGMSDFADDMSFEAVFERADAAMYENKKALKDEQE